MLGARRAGVGLSALALLCAAAVGELPAGASATAGRSITVTPHAGLHSGQSLSVHGAGFAPKAQVGFTECIASVSAPQDCDLIDVAVAKTDAHGAFTAAYTAHRTLLTSNGLVDCARTACVMLGAGTDFTSRVTTPLSFSTTGGPSPALHSTPATGLHHLQHVSVSGNGFRPNAPVTLGECLASSLGLACSGAVSATANSSGALHTDFQVSRVLYNGVTRVDCARAAGTCMLFAVDQQDVDYHAVAPLAFDRSVPPPPAPSVHVQPSTKLPFYAHVTISGGNWTPGHSVFVSECPISNGEVCFSDVISLAEVGTDGSLQASGIVSRDVSDPFSSTSIDCAQAAAHCVIEAMDPSDGSVATAPLSFDPKAPIPPKPSLTLTPAGPYKDHQKVTFRGKHFAPNASFSAGECIEGRSVSLCESESGPGWVTDSHGNLQGTTQLIRRSGTPGGPLDCLDAHVTCTFQVTSEGDASASLPLHFVAGTAPGVAAAAAPTTVVKSPWFAARTRPRWMAPSV